MKKGTNGNGGRHLGGKWYRHGSAAPTCWGWQVMQTHTLQGHGAASTARIKTVKRRRRHGEKRSGQDNAEASLGVIWATLGNIGQHPGNTGILMVHPPTRGRRGTDKIGGRAVANGRTMRLGVAHRETRWKTRWCARRMHRAPPG